MDLATAVSRANPDVLKEMLVKALQTTSPNNLCYFDLGNQRFVVSLEVLGTFSLFEKLEKDEATKLTFPKAMGLASLGYRVRYSQWPKDDYAQVWTTPSGSKTLVRFHANIDEEPWERLPWISEQMLTGVWYFSHKQER